jgi:hypothetical protein
LGYQSRLGAAWVYLYAAEAVITRLESCDFCVVLVFFMPFKDKSDFKYNNGVLNE